MFKGINFLSFFEWLTITTGCLRYGFDQRQSSDNHTLHRKRFFDYMNFIVRLTTFLTLLRIFIMMKLSPINESNLSFYLGDPLYKTQDRLFLYSVVMIATLIMAIGRETSLLYEKCNCLDVLNIIFKLKIEGSQFLKSEMTYRQLNIFEKVVNTESALICAIMVFFIPFLLILLNYPLFTNPYFYQIPILTVCGLIWSVISVFTFYILLCGLLSEGGYVLLCGTYYLFRMRSLCELIENTVNILPKISVRKFETKISSIIEQITIYLNEIDTNSKKIKYLLLFYITVISAICTVYIFIGTVARTHSQVVNNLLLVDGFSFMVALSILLYITGSFIQKVDLISCRLHHFLTRKSFTITTSLKIIEFLDRSKSPYIGIKAGDVITFTKKLFISFILENCAIFLLLIVNLRPLLNQIK